MARYLIRTYLHRLTTLQNVIKFINTTNSYIKLYLIILTHFSKRDD